MTQTEIGSVLGWGRSKVLNYGRLLKNIDSQAWEVVSDTTNRLNVTFGNNEDVSANDTGVSFSENLLRQILTLTPSQQIKLVTGLAGLRRRVQELLTPELGEVGEYGNGRVVALNSTYTPGDKTYTLARLKRGRLARATFGGKSGGREQLIRGTGDSFIMAATWPKRFGHLWRRWVRPWQLMFCRCWRRRPGRGRR